MRRTLSVIRLFVLTSVLVVASTATAFAKSVWYVNANATGSQTGLSWANAFVRVEQAIAAASTTVDAQGKSDEVWCVEGTYYTPVTGGVGGYIITHPIKLYGGFVGTENSIHSRLGSFLNTVLDGDFHLTPTNVRDDALHVLKITGVAGANGNPGVVIDGFRIQHSFANGAGIHGGGILSTQTDLDIANCFIRKNSAPTANNNGGGMYFTSANGGVYPTVAFTLHIKNSEFQDNTGYKGGGLYCDEVRGEVANTSFISNIATPYGAGAFLTSMTIDSANHLDFTNCLFWGNYASGSPGFSNQGGGLYLGDTGGYGGNANLINCTFSDNRGSSNTDGQAVSVSTYSQAIICNSILWFNGDLSGTVLPIYGSATVTYSDIQGGFAGGHNTLADPQFANRANGRLTLTSGSPCLDAADYSQVPLDNLDLDDDGDTTEVCPLDFGFNPRLVDQGSISDTGVGGHGCSSCTYLDMGAYERP